jgi:hypothetical protein
MRHTIMRSSVSIGAVQPFLGHKNSSEMLDVYGHLMPGDDGRVRAAIDASLSGNVHGMCTPRASAVAESCVSPGRSCAQW